MSASGYPIWARVADVSEYGISTDTSNYLGLNVVNSKTDQGAAGAQRMADHIASAARTCPIAVLQYTQDDTTPDDPTVNRALCAWGVASGSYAGDAPPTGFPTVVRQSNGYCRITFSNAYLDDFSVSSDLDIAGAKAGCNDATATVCSAEIVNAYTVDVRCFVSSSGAAATDKTVTVVIS